MGRESSLRTKELFNLSSLVLKVMHLSGSAFCTFIGCGFPRLWVEDKPSEPSCNLLQFSLNLAFRYFFHRNLEQFIQEH